MTTQMTDTAKATFEIYTKLGILDGLYHISTLFNHRKQMWELTGHFQTSECRKVGKLAQFDTVDDAVEFKMLCGF